jgi:hypothetical protein
LIRVPDVRLLYSPKRVKRSCGRWAIIAIIGSAVVGAIRADLVIVGAIVVTLVARVAATIHRTTSHT